MWNRHRESEIHDIREIGSGTKRLFTFLSLKVFPHEERERHTQSFYADCFYIVSSQTNQRAAPVVHKVIWPRPAPKVNLLLPRQELNSLTLLKSPKSSAHASSAWRHSRLLVSFPIWDFYFNISEWHIFSTRAWTPALMLHLTTPCAKQKVLSLTKPKGKIYITKSLGNYITIWFHIQHTNNKFYLHIVKTNLHDLLRNTKNLIKHHQIVCTVLNDFKFRKLLNISVWLIDRFLTGTSTPCQSGFKSNGNEEEHYIL